MFMKANGLTSEEALDLARREAKIRDLAGGSHAEIGKELWEIRKLKYHVKLDYKRIEDYATARFGDVVGTSPRNVQRMMSLAKAAPMIQKCPNGHLIPLMQEGSNRALIEHRNHPLLPQMVREVGLMYDRSKKDIESTGNTKQRVTASKVEAVVKKIVEKDIADRLSQQPKTKKQLIKDFHVSRVEDGLPFIADGEVDLTFTSFPYGCNISYKDKGQIVWDDCIPLSKLLEYYAKWLKVIERITNPNYGRVVINVADTYNVRNDLSKSKIVRLSKYVDELVEKHTDLIPMSHIVWDKGRTNNMSKQSGSIGSYSLPPIERQCEDLMVYYRGNDKRLQDPNRAKLPIAEYMELRRNLWYVNAASAPRTHGKHPCAFPIKLAENVINLFSAPIGPNGEMDVVCDPFSGSGTTACAAYRLHRRYIYNDASQEYAEGAMERMASEIKKAKRD